MSITAKVQCQTKQESPSGDGAVLLAFVPDYQDGRNKEWAVATPALSLSMTVRSDVADRFEPGQRFTLTFEPEAT